MYNLYRDIIDNVSHIYRYNYLSQEIVVNMWCRLTAEVI